MWRYVVIVLLLIAIAIAGAVEAVRAATTADITVTATPSPTGAPIPPINFIAEYISEYSVNITWTNMPHTENTMVRVKYGEGPTDRNDGYLVYYGTAENASDLSVSFENMVAIPVYRAWTENATGSWSFNYAEDSIGEEEVEGISNAISSITGAMISTLIFLLALVFTIVAYKVLNSYFCRIMAGMLWITVGTVWIINDPSSWSYLIFGVVFISIGIYVMTMVGVDLWQERKGG